MREVFSKTLLLMFVLSAYVPYAYARMDLNASEMEMADQVARTQIKADLTQNYQARMYEAAATATEPPLSAETRAVMSRGAYMLIASCLANEHIYITEHEFSQKMNGVLDHLASMGLVPEAFTVGYMARYQVGAGMSIGTQFNFYIDHGILKLSSYSVYGGQMGAAAQTKVQFYSSFCFGSCFGGDPNGWYVGSDLSASIGLGVDAFLEFGIDFTEVFKSWYHGRKYTLHDLYNTKAVYAGIGFDIGVGGGWSVDVFHYRLDQEWTLANLNQNTKTKKKRSFDPRLMLQQRLK